MKQINLARAAMSKTSRDGVTFYALLRIDFSLPLPYLCSSTLTFLAPPFSHFSLEAPTRFLIGILAGLAFLTGTVSAQTAEELVAKYLKAAGGSEKLQSITTLRRTGTFVGGGGFDAPIVVENKRPNSYRREFSTQGLTGITAYNGKSGWKIQPWEGKKDPEPLQEEELKSAIENADFDGPLVNYQQKGNTISFEGTEPVDGTDAYKLKVTLASGDVQFYFLDEDFYIPIKIENHRMVRGQERVYETTLSDYKLVNGFYFPFFTESNVKGNADKWKESFETIEANVPVNDSLFANPSTLAQPH